ncbi:NgoPII family restriction endonuclease [Patescibacteria group bacterium]|nr:NgoPII family restriction endonuclease [Patescibacteria group bacterium]
MEANILKAFVNIAALKSFEIGELYSGKNRMNNLGVALEYFVKDMLCSTIDISDLDEKDRAHAKLLSYLGNQNNPPDFIVKNGDAFEVKKIMNQASAIALNSSYPKSKLHSDDSRILESCRGCDGGNWATKDIVYAVGSVSKSKIKTLWFVYGDCYAASREVYERTFKAISKKVREIDHLEFATETNEIAGVRKVDPLGITYLRIRGMWGIDAPQKVFGSLTEPQKGKDFSASLLMLEK